MAKLPKQPEPEAEVPVESPGPPKSYRLFLAMGFAAFILFEMIALWLLLPTPKEVQQNLGLNVPNGVGGFEDSGVVPPLIGSAEPTEERPLQDGAFTVKTVRGDSTETFSIVLHVVIRKADAKKYDTRAAECTQTIIDAVTTTLSSSTEADRREATYTAIKEKVKKAINEVLGFPWVQAVLVSKPSLDVQ